MGREPFIPLATIGLGFGSDGLREIIIESNVIAEGSVEKIISGKHYNRGMRFHNLMYESCFRLIWESFFNLIEESDAHKETVNQALIKIVELGTQHEVEEITFQSIVEDESVDQSHILCSKNFVIS